LDHPRRDEAPGEIEALGWEDVTFDTMTIHPPERRPRAQAREGEVD
jgi:hypothetical protein